MLGAATPPALLDLLADPVLTLRADLSVGRANPAARAWLGDDAAQGWQLLRQAAGARLEQWLRDAGRAVDAGRAPPEAPPLKLAEGQRATLHLVRERPGWLLLVRLSGGEAPPPLAEWFALSPLPMLLADTGGALLRRNAAFDALCGAQPRHLNELPELLQALLGWSRGAWLPALSAQRAQDPPLLTEAEYLDPQGRQHWLQARLRLWRDAGRSRLLAVLDDQSPQHERDLAHQQLDALMDTAAVGLATFQPEAGWLRPHRKSSPFRTKGGSGSQGSLQGISRDIVEPASLPEFERLQRALKKGDAVEVRYAVRHPELGRRWLLTRVAPGVLAGGRRSTSVVTLDVTAQAQAESALLLRAESERTVLDSVLVGIVTVGPHGIEWMNRSARRMFGCELEEVQGQAMSVLAPADADHPFHLAEPGPEVFECRLRGRDGRDFWVLGNAVQTPREDGPGEITQQLTYALLDIDRRRQAEAQSRQAQASLARVIEVAPLAITLHDAHSLRIDKLNPAASALAGQPEQALLGAPPARLFGAALQQQVEADMREALASRAVVQREYRVGQHEAARVWDTRLLHLAGVDDADDQLLMVASDVTEQRAAEQARLQAEIAQRELLVREVHHRIKNNLQGVAGLLQQNAQRHPEASAAIAEAVGHVHAIAQVHGLQVGMTGPLRVKAVMEAIAQSVQRMFGRPITMEVQGPDPHRFALTEADSIPVALTVNELLTNAIKHSAGGAIACRMECGEDAVALSVANPGSLAPEFNLAQVPAGISGLGLVRALLPRKGASISLSQEGPMVVARLRLAPPAVALLTPL